jgi:hypothetical protein
MDAALDRAGAAGVFEGRDMEAYWCPVCGWWHIGNAGPREDRKRRVLAAAMYVDTLDPGRLEQLRSAWEPQ